ncbi:sarcoplasmic calcium-binding protein isoform X2 [Dendroctonus ponderosae]|uniref:sarcoplasmic calcium-binding protein-like isoform X2 n=1 Tax=Dendroctonus ponderosae TaxID=77166 RepID=UPI002034BAEE|nr:sarcoplasmic calcium-binding protein-like isoform X2 [Dendroctonus ponderosae]XP_048523113.1 sarcoplasmic calcium-binding protein isoform X2 [Dendroctonus ponderosae]
MCSKQSDSKVAHNQTDALSCTQQSCLLTPKITNLELASRGLSSKHDTKPHHERKYQSSSESDCDLEGWLGKRGDSDFWRRKMRTFHSILDLNKDGVISFDDFKLLADGFVDLGHLSEKHTQEFYKVIQDLWEKQFGEITAYNLISVERFLENMHHVLNDKRLVRRAHSFLPYLFKAVDKDASGQITVEEFKLFFNVLGLKEMDAVLAFRAIDSNGDGRISSQEFVKHGRDFFVTEDEERISKYFWGPLVEH